MSNNPTCKEVCGQLGHCGNKHCSNHPGYTQPVPRGKGRRAKRCARKAHVAESTEI